MRNRFQAPSASPDTFIPRPNGVLSLAPAEVAEKGEPMMKSTVLSVVLLNCILLLACTRVQVEILQSVKETAKHTPPGKPMLSEEIPEQEPGRRGSPGAALQSDSKSLTETGEISCATDRNLTPAVAQETGVWCWAASAQGVMSFHKVNPHQCGIVNKVKAGDRTTRGPNPKPFCCKDKRAGVCQQNGWPDQVFDSFGIDYRWLEGPLSQRQVAGQICQNGPFTYSIKYELGGGHTFVVKDYWMDEGEMSLWVDTHESFMDKKGNPYPAGFTKLSYESYIKGWYDDDETQNSNTVDFTYILIRPQE